MLVDTKSNIVLTTTVFEVTFYICDTNEVIRFIFPADLERMLLPVFFR